MSDRAEVHAGLAVTVAAGIPDQAIVERAFPAGDFPGVALAVRIDQMKGLGPAHHETHRVGQRLGQPGTIAVAAVPDMDNRFAPPPST